MAESVNNVFGKPPFKLASSLTPTDNSKERQKTRGINFFPREDLQAERALLLLCAAVFWGWVRTSVAASGCPRPSTTSTDSAQLQPASQPGEYGLSHFEHSLAFWATNILQRRVARTGGDTSRDWPPRQFHRRPRSILRIDPRRAALG